MFSRFGVDGQKTGFLPSKNSYYKNQMTTANNYKVCFSVPNSFFVVSLYNVLLLGKVKSSSAVPLVTSPPIIWCS